MKNLDDLTKSLFASIERLEECETENLEVEVQRSKSICDVAGQILCASGQQIVVAKLIAEHRGINDVNVKMITGEQ